MSAVHAGHARHAVVGHHHVERDLLGDGERLLARAGLVNGPAFLVLEEAAQDGQVVRLVVDEEQPPGELVAHAKSRHERGYFPFVDQGSSVKMKKTYGV
jgi:hypothetical protein